MKKQYSTCSVVSRMPSLSYGMQGYNFTYIDPLTGVQKNPGLRFDTTGKPYNAAAGSPESFMSLGQAFISSAIARSAIAPQWEVRTAECVGANDSEWFCEKRAA